MSCLAVALGDSITYGYPYGPSCSWVELAARSTGRRLVNAGAPGDTSDDLVGRFDRDVVPHRPAYVIVLCGANDAYIGQGPEAFMANIDRLCALAEAAGIRPVLGLPLPVDGPEESLLALYRERLRSRPFPMVDFARPFLAQPSLLPDGLHPSVAGYQLMAQTLLTSGAIAGLTTPVPD